LLYIIVGGEKTECVNLLLGYNIILLGSLHLCANIIA